MMGRRSFAARARTLFAVLIHANPEDVAWVPCASQAAFQVASTQQFAPSRNRIITNDLEFPSITHVRLAQGRHGADVHFIRHLGGTIGA